jgi:hypothetical protein
VDQLPKDSLCIDEEIVESIKCSLVSDFKEDMICSFEKERYRRIQSIDFHELNQLSITYNKDVQGSILELEGLRTYLLSQKPIGMVRSVAKQEYALSVALARKKRLLNS